MSLQQTWRWFGPHDPVTLKEIKQTGAEGIVSALHHIPTGEIWEINEIQLRKRMVEAEGFSWSVVESLPVHEDIKKGEGNYRQYIENYKISIKNLGQCGIDTICYNFMPVLDWSRTDLSVEFKDGAITTRFETTAFAAFDLFILQRPHSENTYSSEQINEAKRYYDNLSEKQRKKLIEVILLGFPGSLESYTLEEFKQAVIHYESIGEAKLRENLYAFIEEIIPVAEKSGVLMAIHPDDPPWSLLGLPRIVSNKEDIKRILGVIDSPSNGLTLCTGSFGASVNNDLVDLAESFADKINFIHLRNLTRKPSGDFIEDYHLSGEVDIYGVMRALLIEQKKRIETGRKDVRMPMRPDHGNLTLGDKQKKGIYPGYSLFGRMRGLAELRGLELGIQRSLNL